MSDALKTYLHDHLAGSHFAIKLLQSLQEQYRDEPLGAFAGMLVTEVSEDQKALESVIENVGQTGWDLTEAAGWIAEKASALKLHKDASPSGIGTFEALETLSLGIRGKLALWRVLPVIRTVDGRIPHLDFEALEARALQQFDRVEQQRLQLSLTTFLPAKG